MNCKIAEDYALLAGRSIQRQKTCVSFGTAFNVESYMYDQFRRLQYFKNINGYIISKFLIAPIQCLFLQNIYACMISLNPHDSLVRQRS